MCDDVGYVTSWDIKKLELNCKDKLLESQLFLIGSNKVYFNVLYLAPFREIKVQLKVCKDITEPCVMYGRMELLCRDDHFANKVVEIPNTDIARNTLLCEICAQIYINSGKADISISCTLRKKVEQQINVNNACLKSANYDAKFLKSLEAAKSKSFQKLQDDFKSMLSNDSNGDIKLKVEDKEVPAHICVLSARSPVFCLMFKQNMSEANTGVVDIPDINLETLNFFLGYLYTGELEVLDSDKSLNLISVAHKYQVESLVERCALYLMKTLTVKNVCEILNIANLIDHGTLKRKAIDFVKIHSSEVFASEEWRQLVRSNFDLTVEVIDKFSKLLATK